MHGCLRDAALVLPSFGAAAGLLAIINAAAIRESHRSIAASLASVAGLTAGLASQNFRGELVPFLAIQRTSGEQTEEPGKPTKPHSWEWETGWRSLFSVTVLAILSEMAIERLFRQRRLVRSAFVVTALMALVSAVGLTPWDLGSTWPWVCGFLACIILLNVTTLDRIARLNEGPWVPMTLAVVWGGSATAVLVLSHSARFADLAILLSCALAGVGLITAITGQKPKRLFGGPSTFVPGLMLAGAFNTYSEVSVSSFAIIAIAPGLLIFLVEPRLRAWFEARPIVLLLTFLTPCGMATALAIRAEF